MHVFFTRIICYLTYVETIFEHILFGVVLVTVNNEVLCHFYTNAAILKIPVSTPKERRGELEERRGEERDAVEAS